MSRCSPLRADHEQLDNPCGLAVHGSRLYVADTGQHRICVLEDGKLRVHAGTGLRGNQDGPANKASFAHPCGIAVDELGNVYVADCGNHTIRMVSPDGEVTTVAGSGESGLKDGVGIEACFTNPCGVTVISDGEDLELYVTDYSNNAVRKLRRVPHSSGIQVSTSAVNGVLDTPYGVTCCHTDAHGVVLYIACHNSSNLVRFIPGKGVPEVLAGCGRPGHVDGAGTAAALNRPNGVAVDPEGSIYVTDSGNHCVRRVTPDGVVSTLQSAHGAPSSVIVCDVGVSGAGACASPDGLRARGGVSEMTEMDGAEVRLLVAARADCCVRMLPVAPHGTNAAANGCSHNPLRRAASSGRLLNLARLLGRAESLGLEEAEQSRSTTPPPPPHAAARLRCMPAACSFASAAAEQARQSDTRCVQEDCVICLTAFDEHQAVRLLRCGHVFHAQCIDEWLERSNCCPCCKADCRRVA